jgi:hypothetical protein
MLAARYALFLSLFFVPATPFASAAEIRLFVVAEISPLCFHCDSFILPLSDPADIADARTLISEGPGGSVGSIPVVQLAVGSDGENRDVLAIGEPLWSWHVIGFSGFADFTIELCDGWPGFIEQDPAAFLANTGGQYCPWSYTVVEELPTPVPALSAAALILLMVCLGMGAFAIGLGSACRGTVR